MRKIPRSVRSYERSRRRRRRRRRRSRRSRLFALFRSPQRTPNHSNPTPGSLAVSGGRVCVRVVCFRAGRLSRPRRRSWACRHRRRRWRRSRRSRLFACFRSPQSTRPTPQVLWWVLVVSGGGVGVRLGAAFTCLRNKTSQRLCLRAKAHSIDMPKLYQLPGLGGDFRELNPGPQRSLCWGGDPDGNRTHDHKIPCCGVGH